MLVEYEEQIMTDDQSKDHFYILQGLNEQLIKWELKESAILDHTIIMFLYSCEK